jgi:hypothetical protein
MQTFFVEQLTCERLREESGFNQPWQPYQPATHLSHSHERWKNKVSLWNKPSWIRSKCIEWKRHEKFIYTIHRKSKDSIPSIIDLISIISDVKVYNYQIHSRFLKIVPFVCGVKFIEGYLINYLSENNALWMERTHF